MTAFFTYRPNLPNRYSYCQILRKI